MNHSQLKRMWKKWTAAALIAVMVLNPVAVQAAAASASLDEQPVVVSQEKGELTAEGMKILQDEVKDPAKDDVKETDKPGDHVDDVPEVGETPTEEKPVDPEQSGGTGDETGTSDGSDNTDGEESDADGEIKDETDEDSSDSESNENPDEDTDTSEDDETEKEDDEEIDEEESESDHELVSFKTYQEYISHINKTRKDYLARPNQETALAYIIAVVSLPEPDLDNIADKDDTALQLIEDLKKLTKQDRDRMSEVYAELAMKKLIDEMSFRDVYPTRLAIEAMAPGKRKEELKKQHDKIVKSFDSDGAIRDPDQGFDEGTSDPNSKPDEYNPIDDGKHPENGDYVSPITKPDLSELPDGTVIGKDGVAYIPEMHPGTLESNYIMTGNSCLKVDRYYDNGKLVRTVTGKPTGAERSLCFSEASPEKVTGSKDPIPDGSEIYNPYDPEQRKAQYEKEKALIEKEKQKQKLDSNAVLYTFNRFAEIPYYNDTGVTVKSLDSISYEEGLAIFREMSIQGDGQFVEEESRGLALIQGQVITLEKDAFPMNFETLEGLFEGTTFDLRSGAEEKRDGHGMMVIHASEYPTDELTVFGEKVELERKILVKREIALFPVETMTKSLGGTFVEHEDGKGFTVDVGEMKIEYRDNQAYAMSRGQKIELFTEPSKEDGVWIAPINSLIKATESNLLFKDGKISIVIEEK